MIKNSNRTCSLSNCRTNLSAFACWRESAFNFITIRFIKSVDFKENTEEPKKEFVKIALHSCNSWFRTLPKKHDVADVYHGCTQINKIHEKARKDFVCFVGTICVHPRSSVARIFYIKLLCFDHKYRKLCKTIGNYIR